MTLRLEGCTLTPLSGYLKSVGVLRVVAEQLDPEVRAHWDGDTFVLTTSVTFDQLIAFFTHHYRPTPIVTPWNSGSGFGPDDESKSPTAFAAMQAILDSTDDRLVGYRATIQAVREAINDPRWPSLDKLGQVAMCRSMVPDVAVEWIDAAVVMTTDILRYPPLLGTGGNDGRLDFGANFMARIQEVLNPSTRGRQRVDPRALVEDALRGTWLEPLSAIKLGQYDPMAAGGPGSSPFGAAESLANPWDFILLFEGAVAFASSVSRRFGRAGSSAAMPFTVTGNPVAYGSAASENTRGEFWAPVWRQPAGAAEVLRLFGEGRVEYRGQQARNGVDVARALATLGVDRGIDQFVRFAMVERNGLSTFCIPVGRHRVHRSERVELLGDVDRWVNTLRRQANLPNTVESTLRRIDNRNFVVADRDDPQSLQDFLCDVALLELQVLRSRNLRAATEESPRLPAREWLPLLDDGSLEFELAAALASLRRQGHSVGFLREILIEPRLSDRTPRVEGYGRRPLVAVLADCLVEIRMRTGRADPFDPTATYCGEADALWSSPTAFHSFAAGLCDMDRISYLLTGLLLLDWKGSRWSDDRADKRLTPSRRFLPPLVSVMKPLFHHRALGLDSRRSLVGDPILPRLLAAGRADVAIASAVRSLRLAGCSPVASPEAYGHPEDLRLTAAACLVPVSDNAVHSIIAVVIGSQATTTDHQVHATEEIA